VECGGGYMKIGPKLDDLTTFGDPTPYNIMFGPDKCGYTKRTHLIFNYKGTNVLKKSDLSYKQGEDAGISHLYRMVLKPDNTVRVEIDEEKIYEGSIKEDWEVLKPKEIPDPDDKKPEDWVDSSMMDDPEDKKPDDWVEEKRIVDESASKPDDWDDEEDGEWEPPFLKEPTADALAVWLRKHGVKVPALGTIVELDEIVRSYLREGFKDALLAEARRVAEEQYPSDRKAPVYLKIMQKAKESGAGYVQKELARVKGIVDRGTISAKKAEELGEKVKILQALAEA